MRIKIIIILFSILITTATSSGQTGDSGLSLLDAVKKAIDTNYNLSAARANLKASEQGVKSARSAYWPKLAFSGSYAHLSKVNEIIIDLPAGGRQVIQTASENPYNSDLMLSWDIYTFGRRNASVGIAKKESELSELDHTLNKKRLFDSVAGAYFTTVFAKEALNLVRSEKQRASQILKLVEDRYNQKLTPEFDLLQMQLRVEQHASSELEFENNYQTAKLNLARHLNLSDADLPQLADSLDEELLKIPVLRSQSELYQSREEYRQALTRTETARYARQATKSNYFPDISLFADYNLRNGYQPDLDKIESTLSFGVNFRWLIFNGLSRKSELSRQNYLWKASQHLVDDLKLLIPYQIKSSMLSLQNSISRIEVGKRSLNVAQKAMQIAQTRYDLGDISMIELLEAENQLSQAELGLLKLKYEYLLAQLAFKAASSYYPELESIN